MLRTELVSKEHAEPCECCGKARLILRYHVSDDDDPAAIVLIAIEPDSREPSAFVGVILAENPARSSEPPKAFSFHVTSSAEGDAMGSLIDGPLTRREALAHPRKQVAIDVAAFVVERAVLQGFLTRNGYDA